MNTNDDEISEIHSSCTLNKVNKHLKWHLNTIQTDADFNIMRDTIIIFYETISKIND